MLEVSKAIIYQQSDYLLQLRDHSPGILYPGRWSFFGGGIEPGETPWQALQRELVEELEWRPDHGEFLYDWVNPDHSCRITFFVVPFAGKQTSLVLHEGQDLGWFSLGDVAGNPLMASHVIQHLKRACECLSTTSATANCDFDPSL